MAGVSLGPEQPQRILIVRPSALGDVCRSVGVLAHLRRAHPGARIDWLVQDTFADAVRAHPALTGVIEFRRAALGRWYTPAGARALRELLARLGGQYDLVIDAQGLLRSGMLASLSGAPRRIGHKDARELGWLAYTDRVASGAAVHAVDRMQTLARAATGATAPDPPPDLRLFVPPLPGPLTSNAPEHAWTRALERARAAGSPWVVLAPTSRWAGKRWPQQRFAELARLLADRHGCTVAIVGSAGERAQCPALNDLAQHHPGVINLMGQTSVAALMHVLAQAGLVVANDSAAVHMAVGLDRPLVALYGPTDVARVGPYRRERDVIQHVRSSDVLNHKDARSGTAMMERIAVDEVLAACLTRLSPVPRPPSA